MKLRLFLAIAFYIFHTCIHAKQYTAVYIIETTDSFDNLKGETEDLMNGVQSLMRKQFFKNTVITAVCSPDTIMNSVNTAFGRNSNTPIPGQDFIDSVPATNDERVLFKFHYDSSLANNITLLDKHTNIAYTIKPLPDTFIICIKNSYYEYKKTNSRKNINGFLCNKWIPADKAIQGKIAIWICDTLPEEIMYYKLSEKGFDGGIVSVQFSNGFAYNLKSYEENDGLLTSFPKISNCDSTNANIENSVQYLIFHNVGLDEKGPRKYKVNLPEADDEKKGRNNEK